MRAALPVVEGAPSEASASTVALAHSLLTPARGSCPPVEGKLPAFVPLRLRQALGLERLGTVQRDLALQGLGIALDQPVDGDAAPQVLADDLGHVGRPHAGIPDILGIDDEVRATLAESERAAGGDGVAPADRSP